jgi:glycosyltransferase involved in cell wall biosynthesis
MKEEKLLSIIVPTYNMERYLSRCLDSLLVSSIIEYIEILVVNDGSKDQSSAIAHNYQERYPQSVKVIDKENGGYGSVLNIGLLNASGKYLKICDSDDWFDSEAFRDFVFQLSKLDTDVVYNSYSKEYLNGKSVKMKSPLDEDIVYNTPYLLSNVKLSRLLCLPEITYKTAVLKEWIYIIRKNVVC